MFPRGGLRRRRYLMSALFCTREFSSATPEDRAARRPRGGICESRRLPKDFKNFSKYYLTHNTMRCIV